MFESLVKGAGRPIGLSAAYKTLQDMAVLYAKNAEAQKKLSVSNMKDALASINKISPAGMMYTDSGKFKKDFNEYRKLSILHADAIANPMGSDDNFKIAQEISEREKNLITFIDQSKRAYKDKSALLTSIYSSPDYTEEQRNWFKDTVAGMDSDAFYGSIDTIKKNLMKPTVYDFNKDIQTFTKTKTVNIYGKKTTVSEWYDASQEDGGDIRGLTLGAITIQHSLDERARNAWQGRLNIFKENDLLKETAKEKYNEGIGEMADIIAKNSNKKVQDLTSADMVMFYVDASQVTKPRVIGKDKPSSKDSNSTEDLIDLTGYPKVEGGFYDITDIFKGINLGDVSISVSSPSVQFNPNTKTFRYQDPTEEDGKTKVVSFNEFMQRVATSNPQGDMKYIRTLKNAKVGAETKVDIFKANDGWMQLPSGAIYHTSAPTIFYNAQKELVDKNNNKLKKR